MIKTNPKKHINELKEKFHSVQETSGCSHAEDELKKSNFNNVYI